MRYCTIEYDTKKIAKDVIVLMKASTDFNYTNFEINKNTNKKYVISYNRERLDYFGNVVVLPKIGDRIVRDSNDFVVSEVAENKGDNIATIELRGQGGSIQIGYYDYLTYINTKK